MSTGNPGMVFAHPSSCFVTKTILLVSDYLIVPGSAQRTLRFHDNGTLVEETNAKVNN